MKIHADKVEGSPPHGLTVRDVRLILATVPPEWIEGLVEVRLANGPGPRAYLFPSDGRLTIYSRSGTKRQILVTTLSVLAAASLNIKSTVSRFPSKAEQHRLEQFIQSFVEQILPDTTPPKKLSPEAHVLWQPIPFPNDAV
jgi:hypothetical protein